MKKQTVVDLKPFDFFEKAYKAFNSDLCKTMSALYYYCDAHQNFGYADRLYITIFKNCNKNQKNYFIDFFKSYKKIPSFDYLWNWYFRHNTISQCFELEASKALFNLLVNDIAICNYLIDKNV